ncbi:hypothetical protein [Altererythrobacter lutimaris]|uniref:Uncharacterized protein n=1 Tax=Altererythrobacter lutimaris TaxID=2743979 RepID=A0A850HCX6_9SPHN|nr:hypothetical protein [Altererythrobacter lutimaris]NVE94921.1 hypothetical protein [Altererythrobacter lutimaris]
MAENETKPDNALQPPRNALAEFALPKLDLVGPSVHDDIQRAIWRYGADAVKDAVKEATKAKRGRKREPDWPELREVIEADARDWLAGNDPFSARSNYAIAKEFSERNPGHSVVSTHKRIERKLSRGPYDRRWFTLVSAENQSRDSGPYEAHIRALEALSELPESARPDVWQFSLDRARSTIADYESREGKLPPREMTFKEIEATVQQGSLNALATESQPRGLFGSRPQTLGLLAASQAGTDSEAED